MAKPELSELFEKNRFPTTGWQIFTAVLYSPFGIVLSVLRVFIALQACLAAAVLPELSLIRIFVLRVMCFILGIYVKEENPSERDKKAQIFIANHITRFDHIPVHIVTGCITPCMWQLPDSLSWTLGLKDFGISQGKDPFLTRLRLHQEKSKIPLLLFPEEATTTGKVGLLKFSPWCASVNNLVQPISLQVWRPFFVNIAVNVLGSSASADLFWLFFPLVTVYKIKYLPTIRREAEETDEQMTERIEQMVAAEMGIPSTKYTAKDMAEYEKRYLIELNRPMIVQTSNAPVRVSAELQRMAAQVSEVLPYIPQDAIIRDLRRTRCVDLTISNILEGSVRYVPIPQEEQRTGSVASSGVMRPSGSHTSSSQDSAPSFPKSAQDRMLSFVERKTKLIEEARRRYMEKHGLIDKQ